LALAPFELGRSQTRKNRWHPFLIFWLEAKQPELTNHSDMTLYIVVTPGGDTCVPLKKCKFRLFVIEPARHRVSSKKKVICQSFLIEANSNDAHFYLFIHSEWWAHFITTYYDLNAKNGLTYVRTYVDLCINCNHIGALFIEEGVCEWNSKRNKTTHVRQQMKCSCFVLFWLIFLKQVHENVENWCCESMSKSSFPNANFPNANFPNANFPNANLST
jgi:hypothetical protein